MCLFSCTRPKIDRGGILSRNRPKFNNGSLQFDHKSKELIMKILFEFFSKIWCWNSHFSSIGLKCPSDILFLASGPKGNLGMVPSFFVELKEVLIRIKLSPNWEAGFQIDGLSSMRGSCSNSSDDENSSPTAAKEATMAVRGSDDSYTRPSARPSFSTWGTMMAR